MVPIEVDSTVSQTISTILECYANGNKAEKLNFDPESVKYY